jgi:hypothetical protein
MKYLKKFENNKIDYRKDFWLINGNLKEIKIILKKFITENELPQAHIQYLSTRLNGLYFGYTIQNWHFW